MKSQRGLAGAVTILQTDLARRFDKFLSPETDDHDPTFLIATSLDPRYRLVLDEQQTASAKSELVCQLKEMRENNSTPKSSSSESQAISISIEQNLKLNHLAKRFRLLSSVIENAFSKT